MTRSLLVVGQSHVAAIRAVARMRRETDAAAVPIRVIHTLEPRYAPEIDAGGTRFAPTLDAAIRDQIDRHRPRIASCIGGNVHNVIGLIRHARPFDFRLSPDDAVAPGAEILTQGIVRALMADAMARDLLRLRLLVALAGPCIHIESPPPLRDGTMIAERADAFFRDRAILANGVADAGLRHRLWRLHGTIMRDACAAAGIGFLPAPPTVLDDDGYLAPAFAADATHGNMAYGAAVVAALENASWPA